jgi:hypothetical protein
LKTRGLSDQKVQKLFDRGERGRKNLENFCNKWGSKYYVNNFERYKEGGRTLFRYAPSKLAQMEIDSKKAADDNFVLKILAERARASESSESSHLSRAEESSSSSRERY